MITTEQAVFRSVATDQSRNAAHQLPDFIHHAIYYPLGFPVRIISNSRAILSAAEESWGCFRRIFDSTPLELQIGVKRTREGILPPEPIHSLRSNLLKNYADKNNFFIANLAKGRAIGWVSETTAASPLYLRYFFLEAAPLAMISVLRAVAIHGACVLVRNKGILLCGDSGAGKSTLAYAGARSGWTYVADDASYLLLASANADVVGNCHKIRFRPSATDLFPEIQNRSVTPRAVGKPSIEVQMSEWPEISTATAATVSRIIFLKRGNEQQELVPLSPRDVLPWFEQHVLATRASRPIQQAALSRLLKSEVHELRYRDLTWAIQRVNQLAEER
jgi:HPr Serine kinase C-terminal domain